MWLWKSQDTLLVASIILKHSKSLMNGLAATMPALIILLNFDGREVSVVQAVGTLRRNHRLQAVVSFFAENVNDKLLLLLEPCFIKRTSHLGLGFLPYGL